MFPINTLPSGFVSININILNRNKNKKITSAKLGFFFGFKK